MLQRGGSQSDGTIGYLPIAALRGIHYKCRLPGTSAVTGKKYMRVFEEKAENDQVRRLLKLSGDLFFERDFIFR